jgi:hypothetical protein
MTNRLAGILVVASALVAAGCAVGRDNVVFVTKTNVAIDLDSTPPALDIGYKRSEMVIEPVDTQGRVLPVLTTVGTRPGAFNWGASHSFATGDAAVVLARYYLTNADLEPPANAKITMKDLEDLEGNEIAAAPAEREAFFFGTNTVLGLGVSWDTSQIPQSVALGYKRKEIAVVPITAKKGKADVAGLASLIATAQAESSVGKQSATGFEVSQSFATGWAATLLATHPALRRVLGSAIIPKAEEAEKLLSEQTVLQEDREKLVDEIKAQFKSGDDAKKSDIVAKAKAGGLVPDDTTNETFRGRLESVVRQPDPAGALRKLHDAVVGH